MREQPKIPGRPLSDVLTLNHQFQRRPPTVNFGSLSLSPTSSGATFYPSSAALWTLGVQVPASALTASGAVSVSVTNPGSRSEEHTSELQSQSNLVCRLLLEKKKKK